MSRMVDVDGVMTEVEDEWFDTIAEPWNEYLLADGTRCRVRNVVTEVLRVMGDTLPDGQPRLLVRSQTIITTTKARPIGGN